MGHRELHMEFDVHKNKREFELFLLLSHAAALKIGNKFRNQCKPKHFRNQTFA